MKYLKSVSFKISLLFQSLKPVPINIIIETIEITDIIKNVAGCSFFNYVIFQELE